ncbi:MAG: hypothetical protein ACR2I2_10675 [Bryobacteraceae bacterium]
MEQDFLQLASTFGRDFRELKSAAQGIVDRTNPDDPASVDEAVFEAGRFVETRCRQGGATMLFQASKPARERERLSRALVRFVLGSIESKRRTGEAN